MPQYVKPLGRGCRPRHQWHPCGLCYGCGLWKPGTYMRKRFNFYRRVKKTRSCWLWIGELNNRGYGQYGEGKKAHRVAWLLDGGELPPGMELDHKCRVKRCVRPDHLELVTHQENRRRATLKYCKRDHRQTKRNRYTYSNGRSRCLPCLREARLHTRTQR